MANQDSGLINILGTGSVAVSVGVYQNVSVSATGTGDVVVVAGVHQNASAIMLGELDVTAIGINADYAYTHMLGRLSMDVSAGVLVNSGPIAIDGSLSVDTSVQNLINVSVEMHGTLNITISTVTQCNDLVIDMDLAFIYSEKCDIKGNSMELIRFRGDTYPITCVLSQNGNTDISGQTFEMSMQIAGGTIYTVVGTVINAGMGMVTFIPDPLAVELAGSGFYDIQSNDGSYDYTYEKGVFTLLDDLTP